MNFICRRCYITVYKYFLTDIFQNLRLLQIHQYRYRICKIMLSNMWFLYVTFGFLYSGESRMRTIHHATDFPAFGPLRSPSGPFFIHRYTYTHWRVINTFGVLRNLPRFQKKRLDLSLFGYKSLPYSPKRDGCIFRLFRVLKLIIDLDKCCYFSGFVAFWYQQYKSY